ncbi:dihydrodipicolinate synthase family protein [Siminovitchia acidinfaciens]|uniref:Dihydrodipicolinate synthase family protein n=1 Tax=Siminovitchia acidinfaciens TaxID=2321395 RepID=A0A429XZC5_9BACI|nr:dihydrodipicolinate synthase family protein [Siminovitchia acidinfaciens]RST74122.1 dihydrodipicolinate synthase family protein [Siminovitchia acidinfaciens]
MSIFQGVHISLVTPMTKEHKVDYKRLGEICDWLIAKGVSGIIAAGPVGEYATLSKEERKKVVETAVTASQGRVPVTAGTGAASTADTIYWAEHALDNGADGILALPPVGYKPLENEVLTHYERLSKVGIPMIVFNNPRDFGIDLTPELLDKMSQFENILAIKEFSGDIRRIHEILEKTSLDVLVGVDDLSMEGALCGATGWTSGVANALPELSVKLFNLARESKREEARQLYRDLVPLFRYDAGPQLIQAIKYMMELADQPAGPTRSPRLPLKSEDYDMIRDLFQKATLTAVNP